MAPPSHGVPFVQVRGLGKTYLMGERRLEVLRDLSLEIAAGELVALTGPSGAGKSTFLHVLGTLDAPTKLKTISHIFVAHMGDYYNIGDKIRKVPRTMSAN